MKTTTNNIYEAQQALTSGKIVKVQHNGLEVRVLNLIPGLYGFGWQVCYTHASFPRAKYDGIMENATFQVYA